MLPVILRYSTSYYTNKMNCFLLRYFVPLFREDRKEGEDGGRHAERSACSVRTRTDDTVAGTIALYYGTRLVRWARRYPCIRFSITHLGLLAWQDRYILYIFKPDVCFETILFPRLLISDYCQLLCDKE